VIPSRWSPPRWSRPGWSHHFLTGALLACLLGVAVIAETSSAAAAGAAEQVQALVQRAAAHIAAVGRDKAFADISRPNGDYVDGDLYVFCDSADGTVLAHGGNPKTVGKNLGDVRDAEGNHPILDGVRLALKQGQGWHRYLWPNPKAGRVQHKVTYVLRIDDRTVCGSGYYELDPP
jgi:cytochrome c